MWKLRKNVHLSYIFVHILTKFWPKIWSQKNFPELSWNSLKAARRCWLGRSSRANRALRHLLFSIQRFHQKGFFFPFWRENGKEKERKSLQKHTWPKLSPLFLEAQKRKEWGRKKNFLLNIFFSLPDINCCQEKC